MMPDKIADEWLQLAYDDWMFACGYNSNLREPTAQIVQQMHTAVDRHDHAAAAHYMTRLRDLSERFSITQTGSLKLHTYELAETRMECARAAYMMDDKVEAMHLFVEAASKYTGHDHWRAVVMWMLGCIQWQLPTRLNDAIFSWESSYELFKNLEGRSDRVGYAEWYRYWLTKMRSALDQAIDGIFENPPIKNEWPEHPETGSSGFGNTLHEPARENVPTNSQASLDNKKRAESVLRTYSVYASIPAGGFAAPPIAVTHVEIEHVCIEGIHYYVHNLHESRSVILRDAEHYVVIKVRGDSMDKKGIDDGDYVLMRVQEVAENGDIVAFEMNSPDLTDSQTTLKQFVQRDGKVVLQPQSTNPKHHPFEFTKNTYDFHVCAVALAVLKRLPG